MDIKNVSKQLGTALREKAGAARRNSSEFTDLKEVMIRAFQKNGWFTEGNILHALENWGEVLTEENIHQFFIRYPNFNTVVHPQNIGVINAGNIPFVGLHDLLIVLFSGHNYVGKNASDDPFLLPWIANVLFEIEPELRSRISFVEKLENIDAVIATGSNNSSRYFEYYFGKYPNIIRKNRNGVAILTGFESNENLTELGKDIFTYFGLGCRNVSKLYVPSDYKFDSLFEAIFSESPIMNHSKYMNNFDYNNSVLLLKLVPFLQNGFLIIREDENIPSPISIVHYERYDNLDLLNKKLIDQKEKLQCIVANSDFVSDKYLDTMRVDFGKTQSPQLWDYADGVDTFKFLLDL